MKKRIKIFLSILLSFSIISVALCLGVTFIGKDYKETQDTAYKILQITDIHILNDEKKGCQSIQNNY